MRLDVTRARRLIRWSRPWHRFEARSADPAEPSIGRLVEELGEQLDAALEVLSRNYDYPTVRQEAERATGAAAQPALDPGSTPGGSDQA